MEYLVFVVALVVVGAACLLVGRAMHKAPPTRRFGLVALEGLGMALEAPVVAGAMAGAAAVGANVTVIADLADEVAANNRTVAENNARIRDAERRIEFARNSSAAMASRNQGLEALRAILPARAA